MVASRLALTTVALVAALLSLSGGEGGPDRSSASLRMSAWSRQSHFNSYSKMVRTGGYRSRPFQPRLADFRPEWQRSGGWMGHQISQNSSVLSQRNEGAPPEPENDSIWSLSVLERSATASPGSSQGRLQNQMRERLDTLQQQLELRERHRLLGQAEQMEWVNQNRAIGRTFIRSLINMQVRDSLRKAEKRSAEVRAVSQVQQKLDAIAISGVAVETRPGWKFGSRADFPRQTGRVWMNSPLLNGSVDFRVGGQNDGLGDGQPVGVVQNEAMTVAVDRELVWNVHSGVTYGGSSRTVTAHVSKSLAPNLTCSVENRQTLAARAVDTRGEQTARVNYQLAF